MKTCVIYFSRTGNTKRMAEAISDSIKTTAFDISSTDPEIVEDFDTLIIGTPVEGFKPAKETLAFIERLPKAEGKKAILFCTHALWKDFTFKMFTPKSIIDHVEGEVYSIDVDGNTITVVFAFTNLHWDSERDVEIGNAHFTLYLNIDTDGDGSVDTCESFGVSVHVEAEGGSYKYPPPPVGRIPFWVLWI